MHQSHKPTPTGTFWQCITCNYEPRHYITKGRSRRETMQFGVPAIRHSLECRCGRSTGLYADLQGAINDWGQRFGQMRLALPPPSSEPTVVSLPRRARRRQGAAHA